MCLGNAVKVIDHFVQRGLRFLAGGAGCYRERKRNCTRIFVMDSMKKLRRVEERLSALALCG